MTSDADPWEILQLISEGFIFVDSDFRILEMNAEAERIDQRRAHGLVGHTVWDCWPDLIDAELGEMWRRSMIDRTAASLEHFYTWPNGRQAWIEMRAFPSNGGLAIFFRDVSDRKQAQEDLRRTQGELIHASRLTAMGAMAATLAHELSQPLTAVSNYIEAAGKRLRPLAEEETRDARQALGLAGAATERAREILKRLRAFVAKGKIEPAVHEVGSIIADASVLILPQAQREGVEIEYRLAPDAQWVEADAIQVQQVLVNLIRNAIEATRDTPEGRVTIATAVESDTRVAVEVKDNGSGISSDQEQLFAPFHSSKPDGLGVGLSISRTIVEAHGGNLEARSAAEGGATFRFTLPRRRGPN